MHKITIINRNCECKESFTKNWYQMSYPCFNQAFPTLLPSDTCRYAFINSSTIILQSHHNILQYSYCLCCSKTSEGTLRCWVRASRASARSWWRSTWSRRTASQHSSVLSPSTSSTSKPLHFGDRDYMFPYCVHWPDSIAVYSVRWHLTSSTSKPLLSDDGDYMFPNTG